MTAQAAQHRVTRPSADPTRDRIVAAAIDLFSERGFEGATTRQIAGRAGVAQPLLNYHFRTKQALWQAAVDSLFDTLVGNLDEDLPVDDAARVERAKLRVREFITFSARNPQLHRIMVQESTTDSDRVDYLVARVRPLYDATIRLFEYLAEQGAVPPIPAHHLYYILTGAGPHMFVIGPQFERLSGLDVTADDVVETHADSVCRLLFGE